MTDHWFLIPAYGLLCLLVGAVSYAGIEHSVSHAKPFAIECEWNCDDCDGECEGGECDMSCGACYVACEGE